MIDPNNHINIEPRSICLSFKVAVPCKLVPILNDLYTKCIIETVKMLNNRAFTSSKYYPELPCVIAKALIAKYQRNKKLKSIKNLVIPVCGDKGRQVKLSGCGHVAHRDVNAALNIRDLAVRQGGNCKLTSGLIGDPLNRTTLALVESESLGTAQ